MQAKIYGTTLYIGKTQVDTVYGKFEAYTFQSTIASKLYVVALTHGDIHQKQLYTRIHSSCVTSETLCGMDCDCVEQLNGALEKIAQEKHGIMFYLIQEGRGAGYVAKARDRMMVQHSRDKMTTFEAYHKLGLKSDHRSYDNIRDICKLMAIDPEFVLLTNNPDKVNGLKALGLNIARAESLEYQPSPFNMAYLKSKQEYGHELTQVIQATLDLSKNQPTVEPFEPHTLPGLSRFVYSASYYIPLKPTDSYIFSDDDDLDKLLSLDGKLKHHEVQGGYMAKINNEVWSTPSHSMKEYALRPYWFRVHVYYDIVTSNDYVILEYKRVDDIAPLVRIHSESIFNRFPLKEPGYRQAYRKAALKIVEHGYGYIALFYQDGRGHGLGTYVLDQSNNISTPDARDYDGICQLLKHHCQEPMTLMVTSAQERLDEALVRNNIAVKHRWHYVMDNQDPTTEKKEKGHGLLLERINSLPAIAREVKCTGNFELDKTKKFIVTGIGSSKSHAMYLVYLLKKYDIDATFLELSGFTDFETDKNKHNLILFSQGMSPNATLALSKPFNQTIIFTAVTDENKNQSKKGLLAKGDQVVTFPLEDEYTLLVRVVGPFCGYQAVNEFMNEHFSYEYKKVIDHVQEVDPVLLELLRDTRPQIKFVMRDYAKSFAQNLQYKFMEGCFYPHMPDICDFLEFSHGHYQNLLENPGVVIILDSPGDERLSMGVESMCKIHDIPVFRVSGYYDEQNIMYYELYMNKLLYQLVKAWDIDQVDWKGKDDNTSLYQLSL
jgi:3,4-dihydroxy 2-butanone 4-phosphate synthase/GTP cyclohydrolase II